MVQNKTVFQNIVEKGLPSTPPPPTLLHHLFLLVVELLKGTSLQIFCGYSYKWKTWIWFGLVPWPQCIANADLHNVQSISLFLSLSPREGGKILSQLNPVIHILVYCDIYIISNTLKNIYMDIFSETIGQLTLTFYVFPWFASFNTFFLLT